MNMVFQVWFKSVSLSFAASLESKFSFAKIWEGKGEGVLMIAQQFFQG